LTDTLGVNVVSPPRINKAGNAAIFTVIATIAPAATETADLVRTLRTSRFAACSFEILVVIPTLRAR
jgi:hypothetical protein